MVYKNNETLTKRQGTNEESQRTRDRWLYDRYRGTIGERERMCRETSTREGRFPLQPPLSSFSLLIVVINKKISGRVAVRDDYRSPGDIDNARRTSNVRFIRITRLIKGIAVIRLILKRGTTKLQRWIYTLDRAFVRFCHVLNDSRTIHIYIYIYICSGSIIRPILHVAFVNATLMVDELPISLQLLPRL